MAREISFGTNSREIRRVEPGNVTRSPFRHGGNYGVMAITKGTLQNPSAVVSSKSLDPGFSEKRFCNIDWPLSDFFTPDLTNNEDNNVLFRSLLKLITDTKWSLTSKHASNFLNKNPFTRSMHLMRFYNKIATLGRPYNNWDEVVRATEDFLERTRWFFSLSPSFTSFPSKCLTLLRFGISSLQRRKEREESEQRNTHKELNTDLTETVRLGSDSSFVTEQSTHWWQKTSLSIAYSATS